MYNHQCLKSIYPYDCVEVGRNPQSPITAQRKRYGVLSARSVGRKRIWVSEEHTICNANPSTRTPSDVYDTRISPSYNERLIGRGPIRASELAHKDNAPILSWYTCIIRSDLALHNKAEQLCHFSHGRRQTWSVLYLNSESPGKD